MTWKPLVHENEHYTVIVGMSEMQGEEQEQLLYKVINKKYGVLELETSWLAKALFEADEFSKALTQHAESLEPQEVPEGFSAPSTATAQ